MNEPGNDTGADRISRRKLLGAAGAMSALGLMGAATPAAARSRQWTWSSTGSVAGSGAGADPAEVWDGVADPVIARVYRKGQVDQVNAALRSWVHNSDPLPAGLPTNVQDFLAEARQLPSWVDTGKLDLVTTFYEKRGNYLGVLYGLGSGMLSTAIPKEARAVYYSKGGADLQRRIARTAKLGYDVGTHEAYQPDGEMVVTACKTRMVHAAVRHLLPQSPHWPALSDQPKPISQADLLVTWHSLPTFVMQKMGEWPMTLDPAEADAFLHLWQVTAHMLGILDEYIPNSWDEANAQYAQVVDPILAPTPEGIELAQELLSMAGGGGVPAAGADNDGPPRDFFEAMTRYIIGDEVADFMQIDRDPYWDPFVRNGWPNYVRWREAGLQVPFASEGAWYFDELLRRMTLFFLNDGEPIYIELPHGNREYYEQNDDY